MSTAFYWDKEQKMPVFERRAGGLDEQRHDVDDLKPHFKFCEGCKYYEPKEANAE